MIDLAAASQAMLVCALWTASDDNGNDFDADLTIHDIAPESRAALIADCDAFILANIGDLSLAGLDSEQIGHDFWLTRNHHGVGFLDRGLGEVGERLTTASDVYGEATLYVGDNGLIYV